MMGSYGQGRDQAKGNDLRCVAFFFAEGPGGSYMAYRPSSLKMREERENIRKEAGLVSERFPGVSSIAFHLTYYHRRTGPVLMKRTLNFFSNTHALFRMDCLQEGCSGGGFDLTGVVKGMVKERKNSGKGQLRCNGKGAPQGHSHASIAYEVSIVYHRSV